MRVNLLKKHLTKLSLSKAVFSDKAVKKTRIILIQGYNIDGINMS